MIASASLTRRLPLLVLLVAAITGAILLRDHLSFDALATHRDTLIAFRDAHYVQASLAFVALYIAVVTFSLPGATVCTLAGGFLFGLFPGVLYNVTGATIGAVLVFLAARAGIGADVAQRIDASGGAGARLMASLRDNEWSVLFLMRLVPAVPFFLANLIPAFVGVATHRFAITTFLGILPAAFVFTSVGAGLSDVFAAGGTPDLGVIFTPPVLLPLLGLAALSALPIVLKAFRK